MARKSKSKKAAAANEEAFCTDSPITPAEFAEGQQLYNPNLTFLERILTAIGKFEQTRKLTPERRDVFYKWLHYGGIKVAPNAFGSEVDQEDMDKDEIAAAKSKVALPDDVRAALESVDSETPSHVVDFLACTRAFLSYRVAILYYFNTVQEVDRVTSTIERFMDYLMQRDVCPEYADDVLATRNFCRKAVGEIWSAREAQSWLPGDFNIACSTLFGGNYGKMYDGETYWGDLQPGESAFVGFKREQATQIVGLGIVGAATEDVYRGYAEFMDDDNGAGLDIVKIITGAGFEIIEIEYPTTDCKDMYKKNSKDYRPVGRVLAKAWKNPLSPPEDFTEEEKVASSNPTSAEPYIFFMEEIIQRNLLVGQKVVATVRQLNCGVWFFDEFTIIYPNFEIYLPNDLVEDYKTPRMLPGAYVQGVDLPA